MSARPNRGLVWLIVSVAAVVGAGVAAAWWRSSDDVLPINPRITRDTMRTSICLSGYTRIVRPPSRITDAIKIGLLPDGDRVLGHYVLDHIIPLTIGGSPRDPRNLQLQTIEEGKRKDRIELKLGCLVCEGQVSLDEAQRAIWRDWRAAYERWAGIKCNRARPVDPAAAP